MSEINWKSLKSGSDIRGVAVGGAQDINLTNEVVKKISLAFAKWLYDKKNVGYNSMIIALGNDCRISSTRIKTCVVSALTSLGVKIYDCALASTPAMLMAVSSLTCTASMQITASHHPYNMNGFKFFTADGALSSSEIDEIIEIAKSGDLPGLSDYIGSVKPINMMSYYCEKIKKVICDGMGEFSKEEKPLSGLKICVDASNGVGGFFVKNILNNLGADTNGSIFLEPNGKFPNHAPNPEDPIAMKMASKAVLDAKADLGVIFDTDVDRVAFISSDGKAINKNRFVAFVSGIVLKKEPQAMIVTDSVTSYKLSEYIEKLGGKHLAYKRGYKNVIDYAKKMNDNGLNCPVAIESSGHVALRENGFIDDGAYLAAKIISTVAYMKKKNISFSDITSGFENAREQIEIRININDIKTSSCSRKVLLSLKDYAEEIKSSELEKNNIEGVKIKFKARWQEGWCMLRKSVHDPVLVLNIESYVSNGAVSILNSLMPFFKKFQFIDINEIDNQLEYLKESDSIRVEG